MLNRMYKWIAVILLAVLLLGMQSFSVHAFDTAVDPEAVNAEQKDNDPAFEVVVPQKDRTTSRKNMVVSFRAPRGSEVKVEVYHDEGLSDADNFKELYEPMFFEIGALERGWVELQLKKGENLLLFTAFLPEKEGADNGNARDPEEPKKVERLVTVKDLEEVRAELSRNVMETSASDLIRRLANMSRSPESTE